GRRPGRGPRRFHVDGGERPAAVSRPRMVESLREASNAWNATGGRRGMTRSDKRDTQPSRGVAVIVGGGPGISASCARLFTDSGMRVAIAARDPDKPVLQNLEKTHGVRRYACDASEPAAVELLFQSV